MQKSTPKLQAKNHPPQSSHPHIYQHHTNRYNSSPFPLSSFFLQTYPTIHQVNTKKEQIITSLTQNMSQSIGLYQKMLCFKTFHYYQQFPNPKTIKMWKNQINNNNTQTTKTVKRHNTRGFNEFLCIFSLGWGWRRGRLNAQSNLGIIINLITYLMQNEPKPCTIDQLKTLWNGLAPTYSSYDSVMETFYYTLVNMLKLNKARHIYEVGCGTGRLIPYTIGIKPEDCTYLATDLSEKMVESARFFLGSYIHKLGVTDSIDKWQERQRLEIGVHDGESSFKTVHKFDRIIANLVLQSTPDPRKMMTSLREVSEQGCLLGISIWGDKSKSNFYNLPNEARQSIGKQVPVCRQNFHLYDKLEQLGSETGWELVVQWQQNSPFNLIEFDPEIVKALREVSDIDGTISSFVEKKVKETFSQKKILNFPVQMAIFRRK